MSNVNAIASMSHLNMKTVNNMMGYVLSARASYQKGEGTHSKTVEKCESEFNRRFSNAADELAHLEHNDFIRRVPGHIYIRLA